MELNIMTEKQATQVNLNELIFMIVKRMKLENTVGKQITNLAGIRKKLLIGTACLFQIRLKNQFFGES